MPSVCSTRRAPRHVGPRHLLVVLARWLVALHTWVAQVGPLPGHGPGGILATRACIFARGTATLRISATEAREYSHATRPWRESQEVEREARKGSWRLLGTAVRRGAGRLDRSPGRAPRRRHDHRAESCSTTSTRVRHGAVPLRHRPSRRATAAARADRRRGNGAVAFTQCAAASSRRWQSRPTVVPIASGSPRCERSAAAPHPVSATRVSPPGRLAATSSRRSGSRRPAR